MTFSAKYEELEYKFQNQVERDNEWLGIKSSYVHNFVPQGPVDYVLVAMEPSLGVPGKRDRTGRSQIARNFTWSVEDSIFHYCVREYLCQNGETYHLTDLAKGAMRTRLAGKRRRERYERWYPILKEELHLLNKQEGTRLITVGKEAATFLNGKALCKGVERVLHYARTAAGHRDKAIEPWRQHLECLSLDKYAFAESIKEVLKDADMDSYIGHRPEGGKPYNLTASRRKLMFYYKNRFGELRNESSIVLSQNSLKEGAGACRWTDNPFRQPGLSDEQVAWLDKRDEALRIFRETGDRGPAVEIGLFSPDPPRTDGPESREEDDNGTR